MEALTTETHAELATRRQAFFETDAVDQLVTMILELAAEQWVLRERVYVIEKAADSLGMQLSSAVENYRLTDEDKATLGKLRQSAIENLMRSVNREHRRARPDVA